MAVLEVAQAGLHLTAPPVGRGRRSTVTSIKAENAKDLELFNLVELAAANLKKPSGKPFMKMVYSQVRKHLTEAGHNVSARAIEDAHKRVLGKLKASEIPAVKIDPIDIGSIIDLVDQKNLRAKKIKSA